MQTDLFPLAIGKEWRSEYVASNVRTGVNLKGSYLTKVVGQETVMSPAGSFENFKIERQIKEYNAADPSRSTETQFTLWYALQINYGCGGRFIAKVEKRLSSNETDELIEFGRKQ